MPGEIDYDSWSKPKLIRRLQELDDELRSRRAAHPAEGGAAQPGPAPRPKAASRKPERAMDPSRYSTRYIALKLAYLGKNYGGFEHSAMASRPSIERELWNALTKTRLIFPEDDKVVQFDCCNYSKCGRTDRGVSAFGQVVGLRVRSNRPLPTKRSKRHQHVSTEQGAAADEHQAVGEADESETEAKPFDHVADELCYPQMLNRILPNDIRILAWCPSPPPGFSARFSCRERQYRYFFTQPAFSAAPVCSGNGSSSNRVKTGWLNIEAMRDAAKRFEGEHDFRNFCKIDPSKQMTDFSRCIFECDIVEVDDVRSTLPHLDDAETGDGPHPKVYYFHVRGSAFLWHQIRHMVAVVFLVGQGLEAPSLVSELLDVSKNPRKPGYAMADEVPLVLWDCIFPRGGTAGQSKPEPTMRFEDSLEWEYVGEDTFFGQFGIMETLWQNWRERKMDELLAHQLLRQVSQHRPPPVDSNQAAQPSRGGNRSNGAARIFQGASSARLGGTYVEMMKSKNLVQSPEEMNEKYAQRKGYESAADMRAKKGIGRSKFEQEAVEE